MNTLLGLFIAVLDIAAIVDIVKRHVSAGTKALWTVFILIFPLIGVGLYFFFGRKKPATSLNEKK